MEETNTSSVETEHYYEMSNDEIQSEIHDILKHPDFHQYKEPPSVDEMISDLLSPIEEAINELLSNLFNVPVEALKGSFSIAQTLTQLIVLLLGVLLVGTLGYFLYRLVAAFMSQRKTEVSQEITQAQRLEARANYVQMAQEAIQASDYRLAIHYLFLSSVTMVIKDSLFAGTDRMTNRELAEHSDFSSFGNSEGLRQLFMKMVYFDEERWFGKRAVPQDDYVAFNQMFSQFDGEVGHA